MSPGCCAGIAVRADESASLAIYSMLDSAPDSQARTVHSTNGGLNLVPGQRRTGLCPHMAWREKIPITLGDTTH